MMDSDDSASSAMARLLRFLERIEGAKISYRLEHVRDSIMVVAAVPGERWEIEFLEDGDVEVERFISNGVTSGDGLLDALVEAHGAPDGAESAGTEESETINGLVITR